MFNDPKILREFSQESRDILDRTVSALPGGVAIYKIGTQIETMYFSEKLPQLTGYTKQEYQTWVQGDFLGKGVFAEDCAHVREMIFRAVSCDEPVNVTFRAVRHDGSLMWLQLSGTKIGEDGSKKIYYAIYTKPSEEEIQYYQIVSDSSVAVMVADYQNMRVLYANAKMNRLLGYSRNERIIGREILKIDAINGIKDKEKLFRDLTEDYSEFHVRDGSGRYFQITGKRTLWCGQSAVIYYVTDETQLLRTEFLADNIAGGLVSVYLEDGLPLHFINNRLLQLLGYSSEAELMQATGGRFENAVYPQDRKGLKQQNSSLNSREEISGELRLRKKDGGIIWVYSTGKRIRAENGRSAVMAVCEDITKVKEANRRFDDLIENMDCGLVLCQMKRSEEIKTRFVSGGMSRLCGMTYEETLAAFSNDLTFGVAAEYRDSVIAVFRKVEATGYPQDITFKVDLPQSKVRWAELKLTRAKHEDGTINFYFVFLDATDRVEAQQRAEEASGRYKRLYDRVKCGIAEYEITDGRIHHLSANAAAIKMLGYSEKELSRKSDWMENSIVYEEDIPQLHKQIGELKKIGDEQEQIIRLLQKDGNSTWVSEITQLTESEGGRKRYESVWVNVNALKQAERMLAAERRKIDFLLSNANIAFCAYYPAPVGKIIALNKNEKNMFINDSSPKELVERGIIHPDSAEEFLSVFSRLDRGDNTAEATIQIENINGEYRWMRFCMKQFELPASQEIIGWGIDVNQAVEAREKLENEIRYQEETNAHNLMAKGRYNITDNVVEMQNEKKGYETGTGSTVYSENALAIIYTAATAEQQKALTHILERGHVLSAFARGEVEMSTEYQRVLTSGLQRWTKIFIRLFSDSPGGKVMAFLYTYDIDEERRRIILHQRLSSAIYDYLSYVDTADGSFHAYIIDENSPSLPPKRSSNYTEVWNRIVSDDIAPEDREEAKRNLSIKGLQKALDKQEKFQFVVQMLQGGEVRLKEFTAFYMDKGKEHIVITREDVTEQMRREGEATERLSRALTAANQASIAKSQFLSRVSHEIRTPINAILGIAELEQHEIAGDNISRERILNYCGEIKSATAYLLKLVNDLLDINRVENNKIELLPTVVNMTDFLDNLRALLRPIAEKKDIKLQLDRKTHFHASYRFDAVRLKQIITNLVSNAVKFSPVGETVKLSLEASAEKDTHTVLRFTVSDNGIGMTEEFQRTMFDPFVQENMETTSPFDGTGLGLSIARTLVQKMGGDIVCHSVKGEGTSFIFSVLVENVRNEDSPTVDEENASSGTYDFSGMRILLCEDHPLNREITKSLLERCKCEVETAETGEEGLNAVQNSSPGYYSLILMDIRMPVMDGLQAARNIRRLDRPDAAAIPIVAMSANAYEEDVEKSLAAGMNAHLAKPVDAKVLYQTVKRFVE